MPKIPFIVSDDDWRGLTPKPIDKLGRARDLTIEEEERLNIFRQMDLRVEWVCSRAVVNNNRIVFLAIGVIALYLGTAFGQRALEFLNLIYQTWKNR